MIRIVLFACILSVWTTTAGRLLGPKMGNSIKCLSQRRSDMVAQSVERHANRTATVLEWHDRHKAYNIWFKRRRSLLLSSKRKSFSVCLVYSNNICPNVELQNFKFRWSCFQVQNSNFLLWNKASWPWGLLRRL